MQATVFDFVLPDERIAQCSVEPRDQSKLMIVHREHKTIEEKQFFDSIDYFRTGDVLVWNNSKVFKARLKGSLRTRTENDLWEHKRDIELFLVRPMHNDGVWKVLAKPGKHVQNGMRIVMHDSEDSQEAFYCDVMVKEPEGTILVQFPCDENEVREKANVYGSIPIPPYVKDEPHQLDMYQTVYAQKEGSVAAPTAGFHFTDSVIKALKQKGVHFAEVTLHVGLGTFLPMKTERIEDHTMHSEWVELSEDNAKIINAAKKEGRRVIAVGTTTTRTLEGIALLQKEQIRSEKNTDILEAYTGDINIFITPGFSFQIVDALITNFHLPKSTLLVLVSAFIGDTDFALDCYRKAVENEYRFYSFGDAMFIC